MYLETNKFKRIISIIALIILLFSCVDWEASYDLQTRKGYVAREFGLESIDHIPRKVEGRMFECNFTSQEVIHAFGSCGIQFGQYLDSAKIKEAIDNTVGLKLKSTDKNSFFIYMDHDEINNAVFSPNLYPIPYLNSHLKRKNKTVGCYEVILIEYSNKNIMNPLENGDGFDYPGDWKDGYIKGIAYSYSEEFIYYFFHAW